MGEKALFAVSRGLLLNLGHLKGATAQAFQVREKRG
jgi:hypothetical protein